MFINTSHKIITRNLFLLLVILSVLAGTIIQASAEETQSSPEASVSAEAPARAYYKDREKGWFWYLEEKKKEEARKTERKPETQSRKRLEDMTTDELKAYSEEKLKAALDQPTVENVREYMVVQKFIMEKAQTFTTTWQQALRLYPDLDWTIEHPVSTVGLNVYKRNRENQIDDVLSDLAQYAGLFFFYNSRCPYCREQAGILKTFQYQYEMNVMAVSLDGGGLPEFPDYRKDNGIAGNLGVARVPTIVLAVPPEGMAPVSVGIATLSDLRERIYDLVTNPEFFHKAAITTAKKQ